MTRAETAPSLSGDLRTKLTWLAVFRTVSNSVLLLVVAARYSATLQAGVQSEAPAAFVLIGVVYAMTLVYGFSLRSGWAGSGAAYGQLLGDVVLASCVVFVTGGIESPFTFTYSVAVVAGAILLQQRGALAAAAVSSIAFAVVVVASGVPAFSSARVIFTLAVNSLAQVVIAVLASYLAKELTAAGGRLVARDAHIRRLLTLQDQIVAAIPSGLITFDDSTRITFVNPAAEMILGLVGPMAGEPIEQLLPGVTQVKPSTRRAELSTPTPQGTKVLGLAVTPLQGTGGAALVVFQDLTGLRKVEEQLRTADHLASLGRLSAQLAHEIRNPLASMRGAAQMLADEAHSDAASSRLSGILVRESDRLARLVEDFLRFSRPAEPVFATFDLRVLVEETLEMLRTDPLARSVDLAHEGPSVLATADEAQLRQVLINLVRNALVAAGAGGVVRVRVRDEGGKAQIIVWDSAGKIPATDLRRIFEPFYTTHTGGTGLGLSTAHSIISAHGGSISVTSSPASGTEFVVSLPEGHVARTDRR